MNRDVISVPHHHGGRRIAKAELHLDVKESTLVVGGEQKLDDKERNFLHRGIAVRSFERRFQLANCVEVKGAEFKDGPLHRPSAQSA